MAKTTNRAQLINAADGMTMQLPTMLAQRYDDGRAVGVDGSVWLFRGAPMGPIADSASVAKRIGSFQPLMALYEELEKATTAGALNRRKTSKGQYRDTHLLLVNVNRRFGHGIPRDEMVNYLKDSWSDRIVPQRFVIMGVKLRPKAGSTQKNGGVKAAIKSFADALIDGKTSIDEYDEDAKRIGAMFDRSGFRQVTPEEFVLADSWWSQGGSPDTVNLAHSDHMHVFTTDTAVAQADRFGKDNCEEWPEQFDGHHIVTFGALESMKFDFISPEDGFSQWIEPLLADGVSAISIRAKIEPQTVTRTELRQQRKNYERDLNEAAAAGKMDRQEVDEKLQLLTNVEGVYATNSGTATLTDTSVVIAFDGLVEDMDRIAGGTSAAVIRKVPFRQQQLLAETMICSAVMGNPSRHDMPAQTIAASGVQALSVVGDKDGAIIGFTLRDSQIARFSPTAASLSEGAPLSLTPGATGSGKSMTMLWKAWLYDMLPTKNGKKICQVIIDPKTSSDFSDMVLARGGTVASLDDLQSADGVFDPLRFAQSAAVGVELAVSMLVSIDPYSGDARKMEVQLYTALSHGVNRGATCIGQALQIAFQEGKASRELIQPIWALLEASPMFRACVGLNPASKGLSISDGITLIKVGSSHLDLPEPGNIGAATLQQRTSLALVRMMVFGSTMAMQGRGGVIHMDEAWVFLGAGRAEVERLGRVARSMNVLGELYTQRVGDALKAELTGYISRLIIMHLSDPKEALAACTLANLEPTPERLAMITAGATLGDGTSEAPNFQSLRALKDPKTGAVIRGSVGIYSDLKGRAVPVEFPLPKSFLDMVSTNPEDVARRAAAKVAAAA